MDGSIRAIMWKWGGAPEQVRRYQQQIKMFRDRQADFRDISAVQYEGSPKTTAVSDPTGRKALKILELMELYEKTIEQTAILSSHTCELMTRVDKILDEVSPLQRQIAYLRYRDKRPWIYITIKLNISDSWARKQDELMCRFVNEKYNSGEK